MKEINIYKVKIIESSEDLELPSVIRNIEVAANNMIQVISDLTDGDNPFCKERDIKAIEFDKTIYACKYL